MDEHEARRRFAASPVARLGTVRPDGAPHLVPVTFALAGDAVFTAIDHKPKRDQRLQRLTNLRHEPRCTLLVDRYDAEWSRLWWVRADGQARVIEDTGEDHEGLRALRERYPAYRNRLPAGPLIEIAVARWRWWSGS